jgi:KGK domain
MEDRFESLESGEVISVKNSTQVLTGHSTFRVGELSDALVGHLAQAIAEWNEEKNAWFSDQGIDCEALRFGSNGWQKGRIRLCLEFCPDESTSVAHSNNKTSIPTTVSPTKESTEHAISAAPIPSHAATTSVSGQDNPTHFAQTDVTTTTLDRHEPLASTIPTISATVIGTAAVAAIVTPDLLAAKSQNTIPHLADPELEEHPGDPNPLHSSNLDEIAFDFDVATGTMELDLTDLSMDFSEHDLLSFEANGMSDASSEFINLQDLDRPENSGMLIDEVWNEMNRDNWPGIN